MSTLPKHWKDEHVIVCLVRNMIIIDNEVIQSELDWMAKTGEDYAEQGIDVPSVWDSVDDEILEIAKTPGNYPKLVVDAIHYISQNFDYNKKQTLMYYLMNMAAQDDVVNYPEYISLRSFIDSWFPGQEDLMMNDIRKGGIKVITNDPTLESGKSEQEDTPSVSSGDKQEWTIIHDLAVFYTYMGNLADGMMKEDEMKIIRDIMPKWNFIIDEKSYGISIGNPENLEETMNVIYDEMYGSDGERDPMGRVNQSQKNLVDYYKKGGILNANIIGTFLNTMFQVCKADDTISEGQAHQLSYYCNQWLPACPNAQKTLVLLELEISRQKTRDALVESGIPEEVLSDLDDQIKSDANESKEKSTVPETEADDKEDPVESFREFMAGEFTGMKLPKNKNYGEYVIGSGMLICFMAKKSSVSTYLYSSGKLPAKKVFEKINSLGLSGKVINDKYTLTPMPGSRNPNVVRIDIEIKYDGRDLNSAEMRAEVKDVYGQLLELCKPIV